MKKGKQIFALIGVVLLIGLYIVTLIAACFASPASSGLFLACIYATFIIPVLIWLYQLFYKLSQKHKDKNDTNNK